MSEKLLPSPFLFRFAVPCAYRDLLWTPGGAKLDDTCRIPAFAALEDVPEWADVRAGWSESGLAFSVEVHGKRQRPWCREGRIEDSDGLTLWIDTRDTHNVHRATRFCHCLKVMPAGGGARRDAPLALQLPIDRAKEQAGPVAPGQIQLRTEKRIDGYVLAAFIPAAALTGFDPAEHPRLGFDYQVLDREIGEQTFAVGSEFPHASDPSLWGTLELC